MNTIAQLKKRLSGLSITGNVKVHPHSASHGKSPHSGSDFGTEMKEYKKGGKKRTHRVKSKKSKSKSKSKSKRSKSKRSKSSRRRH